MTTLLQIESSARGAGSHTRQLGRLFVDRWRALRPQDGIVLRDVGRAPPAPVTEAWIAAAFTKPERRTPEMRQVLAGSDALVDELERADLIVAGVPMYNFGMPATMKAYVDNIVRVGRTFAFDRSRPENPYTPLLKDKRLVILSARGDYGYGPGERMGRYNHVEAHLASVFEFLGIPESHSIAVEYDEFGDERFARSLADAEAAVERLAAELAEAAKAESGTA